MNNLPALPHSHEISSAVRFEGNRLEFDRVPTKDELQHLLALLKDCTDHSTFWVGDTLSFIRRSYGEDHAKEAAANFYQPELALEAMRVVEHLDGERFKLSYLHHKTALQETGSIGAEAIEWLRLAEQNQWSPAQLREAIRKANGTAGVEREEGSRTSTIAFSTDLRKLQDKLKKVTENKPVDQWSNDECAAFLNDSRNLVETLVKIQDRFAELNPEFSL